MKMFLMLILAMASLFFIACGDSNTTVKNKNCANSCDKTWQQCNEETQKCEPKEGFCATDEACKSDETKPKCNNETHVCVADKCSDEPCKDNTEAGNTVCKLDASTEGFSCVCEEGFELKEDKCVEVITNPCDSEPCKDNAEGKTVCKVDESATDGYICEKPATDDCNPNPCENSETGETKCSIADNTDGYTCSCEDGFELVGGKCVEQTCNGTNECDDIDATKCDADKLLKCTMDDTTYCTVWKEVETCDADKCVDASGGVPAHCEVECDNICTLDETKCTGDRIFKCVTDDATYCTVWKEEEDCGAGLCTDNNDGVAYCECQECDPDTFGSTCSEDLKSFQYCDNTDGCFTIKTINCEGAKHCATNDSGNLECVENTCTDDPACTSDDTKKCATSGGASILQGCKTNNEGCLELYTLTDCSANNMTCSEYESENQCLGSTGEPTCQNSGVGNGSNEILMNGIWVGHTKNQDDNYQGCAADDFDGQDTVYIITVEQGANLNLKVKKLEEESSIFTVTPSIYVIKGNCNNSNNCNSSQAENSDSDASASLSLTNMDAGTYHVIVDSDEAGTMMTTYDTYKYELTVDLQ